MAHRPLVLVADDDPDIRLLVQLRLERSGFSVVSASDGAQALELAETSGCALAILDVTMPGVSGTEVTRALRQRQNQLPVILLTANARETDILAGGDAGADAYVTKPFSPQELETRVRALTRV
jgi:DNA-binding response OmpR family regulator